MRRVDLFNIIDILAIKPGEILGVQSTSWAARQKHLVKLKSVEAENTKAWLESGAKLQLITWKKVKIKRGGSAFRYEPFVEEISSLE